MKGTATRALRVGVGIAVVLGLLHWSGVGLRLLLAIAAFLGFVAWALPWMGVRLLDDAILHVRSLFWAREQGRFHSFGGVPLQIEDDGRHVWVDGGGLQRVLGRRELDEALAARHSGRWRRTDDGRLMLRVDAVVGVLATMPGRDVPRVQRLRRYFEREVLYPAAQRHRRRQRPPG
jgi:hypothetical protein